MGEIPDLHLILFDSETAIMAFCETCCDEGVNPLLYLADKVDAITLATARRIKYGEFGHGPSLDHEVTLFNRRFEEFG